MASKSSNSLQCVNGFNFESALLSLQHVDVCCDVDVRVDASWFDCGCFWVDYRLKKIKKNCPVICSVTYWHTVPSQNIPEKVLFRDIEQVHTQKKNIVQCDGNESFTEGTREKSSECAVMHWEEMTQKKSVK